MLFDLNRDPYEMNNLADDPRWAGKMRELTGRIGVWQECTGDMIAL